MPRSRKNITRKRGGFWPFSSSSSTTPSSLSNTNYSWWNPFSDNFAEKKSITSSYMPSTSYSPPASYARGSQSMFDSRPQEPSYGGKRRKSSKVMYVQRSVRPSLSRTGGRKKRMTKKRKH